MTPEQAIVAILEALPSHSVTGKKRLQKLAFLLKLSGVDIEASFQIKTYGPFSQDIELACTMLSLFGDVEEKEVVIGYAGYLATEYSLTPDATKLEVELNEDSSELLLFLDKYPSVDLEVAATVAFFRKNESSIKDAISSTEKLKATKVNLRTLKSSEEIIARIGL